MQNSSFFERRGCNAVHRNYSLLLFVIIYSFFIPIWLVLAAIGFAVVVGLLSGIVPASRAVRISALEAIRHD